MDEQNRAPSNEVEVVLRFGAAAQAMLAAGLRFARTDDPAAYAEVNRVLAEGRARPQLMCEFHPQLAISMRLVGHDGLEVVEVFRFSARTAVPNERPS